MRCPCCEKPLEVTHRERHQDLSEHVSSPNRDPSMKNGYQCMNEYFIANNLRCTWIDDGEIYIDPPKCINWSVAHRTIEKSSVSGMYYALDSWMHYYESGKNEIKRRTKVINAFNYRVEIEPKAKGWKYPEDQRYHPSLFRYNFRFWKKTGEHSYSLIVPVLRMIRFTIKEFNNSYKRVIEHNDDRSLEKCFEYLFGKVTTNPLPEKRYMKISRLILSIFYQEKKKNIVSLYQEKFLKREWI
jgi:hypothetical protein